VVRVKARRKGLGAKVRERVRVLSRRTKKKKGKKTKKKKNL
jgi:hypothetical protein